MIAVDTSRLGLSPIDALHTLSPCAMCTGALLLYGIPRVIVGENRTFLGEEELLRSRGITVEVAQSEECIKVMRSFIAGNPRLWNEDMGE